MKNISNIKLFNGVNRLYIDLSIIILFAILVFIDTWRSIIEIWIRSETFTHGFLIAPISIWLVWTKKTNLKSLPAEPAWIALIFIILNGLIWLLADMVNASVIKQYAVVGILISAIWLYLGHRITKIIIFPLIFLYLMVPVGEALLPYLMEFTANFTVRMLRLTGITVYQEGLLFTLPTGNWSVIEACSGLRYLIASTTLGLVYAYTNYHHFYKRLIFSLLSIIVPIIANGFRAYMIVMIGHLSDMKLAVGIDHVIYGAIFFGVVMLILFFIGSFWRDTPLEDSSYQELHSITISNINLSDQSTSSYYLTIITIAFSLLLWPYLSKELKSHYHSNLTLNQISQLNLPSPWHATDSIHWPWIPSITGAVNESFNSITDGEINAAIYQANFGDESQSSLVSTGNDLIRHVKKKWSLAYSKKLPIFENGKASYHIDEALIKGFNSAEEVNIIVLKWYQIGNTITSNPYKAKLNQLIKRLTLDSSPEILVMLFAKSKPNEVEEFKDKLLQIVPALNK